MAIRLTAHGLSETVVKRALAEQQQSGVPVEEALIAVGVEEHELLAALGSLYDLQYVSSKKLERAQVSGRTLQTLPRSVARQWCMVPILLDTDGVLTVVAARPGAPQLADQIMRVSGARGVRLLVARPTAVRSAIVKLYDKDGTSRRTPPVPGQRRSGRVAAREAHGESDVEVSHSTGAYRTRTRDDKVSDRATPRSETNPAARSSRLPQRGPAGGIPAEPPPTLSELRGGRSMLPPSEPFSLPGLNLDALDAGRPLSRPPPGTSDDDTLDLSPEFDMEIAERESISQVSLLPPAPGSVPAPEVIKASVLLLERLAPMIDNLRGRGAYTTTTAATMTKLSRELGAPLTKEELRVAALLHGLGELEPHITPLRATMEPAHRTTAEGQHMLPLAVGGDLDFPETALDAVASRYERFDGTGFPRGLSGEDIPLGARLLAVAESYADLITDEKNFLNRRHSPREALTVLRAQSGKVFDPEVVQALVFSVGHDRLQ